MRRRRNWLMAMALTGLSTGLFALEVPAPDSDALEYPVVTQVRLLAAGPDADGWLLGAWLVRFGCMRGASMLACRCPRKLLGSPSRW